ncbi:phage tail tube protein [Phascolarctobacterium succinatutens]|uniref:phage tail tube protein n=1 Tax=Phascolarctobacterium succinatutens TaxID=626940 RepID=UPI0026F27B73|nr:phage major tail protein, TP901-1 family [Phascolarctobacterium succinatutens]
MSEYTFPTRTDATSTATAGKDYLIYLNTGTTEAAPTWTLLGGQRSGDLNREADEIDASHKTSGGWKSTLPGLRSWSIDLETIYLAGDIGAKFLEAAFLAGKQVHVKFEYPDKSFVTGWGSITECSLSTPHDDVATLKGTISGDGPLSEQSKG